MELLVVTVARTISDNNVDGSAHIRLIAYTVQNAPGLVTARFYRSREQNPYYFILTTWEDEEFWQKAQERYNPEHLLLGSTHQVLSAPPEQWVMSYLWGYSRPFAQPALTAAHIATVRLGQTEALQSGWIESLRRQVALPTMAFSFLARTPDSHNVQDTEKNSPLSHTNHITARVTYSAQTTTFLNLLSWPSETAREEFYADQQYKALTSYLSKVGVVRIFALEPV